MNRQFRREDPDLVRYSCHVIPGDVVIVCVHGEIDCLTAPDLTACLDQQLGPTVQPDGVEVALTHVTFLDGRGITTLVAAAHTARRRALGFRVTGCSPRLLSLLDLLAVREELAATGSALLRPHGRIEQLG